MKLPFFCQLVSKIKPEDWNFSSVEDYFNRCFPDQNSCEWRISDVNKDFKVY